MKLQLALDLISIADAVRLVAEVENEIDIIEVGTPFIIQDGMAAVRALREAFPRKTILADVKIMDGGSAEAAYAFDAGADLVTVLAAAEDQTIRNVVAVAKARGGQVMADMIAVADVARRAVEVDALGVDYICVHTAFDIQHTGENPLDDLHRLSGCGLRAALAVAGGLKVNTLRAAAAFGPAIAVVGGAITGAQDKAAVAREMRASAE